jgi:hypothetical protein
LKAGKEKAVYSGGLEMKHFDLATWTGDQNFGMPSSPFLIALVLHISNNPLIMGTFVNGRWSNFFGGVALLVMTAAAGALVYFMV